MRNLFLTFLFTGISFAEIIAQTLSAGYIVNTKKDTIRGFIAEGIDLELAQGIEFNKENATSGSTKYAPSDLLGFGFDYGRTFERFTKPSITKYPQDSVSVFAKKNISGKIRLYTIDIAGSNQPDMVLINSDSHRKVYLSEPKKKNMTVEKGEQKIFLVNAHLGLLAYVKNEPAIDQKVNYTEKSIKKDILNYNNRFINDFPVNLYKPRLNYFHDVIIGVPIVNGSGSEFRIAAYRNRYSPETTKTSSIFMGVSYRYRSDSGVTINGDKTTSIEHVISVIPLGLNFHSGSGIIRPYFYFGIGLVGLLKTNHTFVNSVDTNGQTSVDVLPTLNTGAGFKIKIASQFLMIEATPTYLGDGQLFLNVGYSF